MTTVTGWADNRLMQAYDLIHETMTTHRTEEDSLPEFWAVLRAVEEADQLLAGIAEERAA
jgi:hypothetical protein